MKKTNLRLVEISGLGCASCEAVAPVARAVAQSLGLEFVRWEAESGALPAGCLVERVPALLLMDGERQVCACYGYQPQEILELYLEDKINAYEKENHR